MKYIISYNDRTSLNNGTINVKDDNQLQNGLNMALGRIGAGPSCQCKFKDGSYEFQASYKYIGIISLRNEKGKYIQFPKSIHEKLMK